jgi:TPR repeat protein
MYWFQRAGGRGNADAFFNLALIHESGKADPGGRPDLKTAMRNFQAAAKLGSLQARPRSNTHTHTHSQSHFLTRACTYTR